MRVGGDEVWGVPCEGSEECLGGGCGRRGCDGGESERGSSRHRSGDAVSEGGGGGVGAGHGEGEEGGGGDEEFCVTTEWSGVDVSHATFELAVVVAAPVFKQHVFDAVGREEKV